MLLRKEKPLFNIVTEEYLSIRFLNGRELTKNGSGHTFIYRHLNIRLGVVD